MLNSTFKYKGQDYLDQRYFIATIVVAIMLHMVGLYAWMATPSTGVVDVPVRALSIKLGEGEEPSPEELKAVQPETKNTEQVEDYLSRLEHVDEQEKVKEMVATKDAKVVAEPVKQYVHMNPKAVMKSEGSDIGNSRARDAEIMSRYEQLVTLWVIKFKIYPEDAHSQGIEGKALVRFRIDRQGNVIYCSIERSSGSDVLDRAAVDMVRRANPVPAVPNDYPAGELNEYVIGVNFFLSDKKS